MGNEEKSELQIIRKRLDLGNNVLVRFDEQENFYRLIFDDGFQTWAYSDNKFFYQKSRQFQKSIIEMNHRKYLIALSKYENFKEYSYSADAGSLLLGTVDFAISLGNGYGDGCFKFRVYDEDIDLAFVGKGWKYERGVEGNLFVFDYDCLNKAEREEAICNGRAVKLAGRYAIYRRDARCNFAFVKLADV